MYLIFGITSRAQSKSVLLVYIARGCSSLWPGLRVCTRQVPYYEALTVNERGRRSRMHLGAANSEYQVPAGWKKSTGTALSDCHTFYGFRGYDVYSPVPNASYITLCLDSGVVHLELQFIKCTGRNFGSSQPHFSTVTS